MRKRQTSDVVSKIAYCFFVLSVCLSSAAFAAIDPSQIGLGARMIALGRSSTALDNDSGAPFINPAQLALVQSPQIDAMYANLGDDLSYRFVGLSNGLKIGGVGIAYVGSALTGFSTTTYESGRVVNTGSYFDYLNTNIQLSYGKELRDGFCWGINAKFLSKGFTAGNGNGTAVSSDLGLFYVPKESISVGLVLQNLAASKYVWQDGGQENLEQNTRFGLQLRPTSNLLAIGEVNAPQSRPATFHGGVELTLRDAFALRAGIDQVPASANYVATNFTGGIGLKIKGMSLDYAYYYDTVLTEANSSHYFSLGYQWPNVIVQQPKVDFVIPETKDAGVDPQMYFLDDLDVQTSLNMLDQNKLPEKSSKKKH